MWKEAIELYKELGDFEKVGDLYALQRKRKEADFYYEKQVEQYRAARQLVKAALIYKNKIGNASLGQDMLLEGWKLNADAYNCLCNYFSNIEEAKDLMPAMSRVYTEYVSNPNYDDFLRVIRHSFERHTVLQEPIRDIAYEIISKMIQSNPWAVGRLNDFQPTDKLIAKDTLRFRTRS